GVTALIEAFAEPEVGLLRIAYGVAHHQGGTALRRVHRFQELFDHRQPGPGATTAAVDDRLHHDTQLHTPRRACSWRRAGEIAVVRPLFPSTYSPPGYG